MTTNNKKLEKIHQRHCRANKGFVPWIILLIYGFAKEPIKCIQVILILALILLFSGGGTWGITTLGRLL